VKTENQGRRFVISDIHGCKRTFKKLLKKIEFSPSDTLYIIGDMINRGNNSSGVLNHIIKLRELGYKINPIRGNHEQMLLDVYLNEKENIHSFLRFYKSADLLNTKGKIEKSHIKLLTELPYYYDLDNFILVHAAIDLTTDDIFENKEFMLYSRYQRGNLAKLNDKKLIHGHVAQDLKIIKKSIIDNEQIIGIDNGCIYKDFRKGQGRLVCLELNTMTIITQKYAEKSVLVENNEKITK
jgi:serine/threonine protein phosphatase 1